MFKLLAIFDDVRVLWAKKMLHAPRNDLVVIYFVVYLTIMSVSETTTAKSRKTGE
jgi:hypothetical protein